MHLILSCLLTLQTPVIAEPVPPQQQVLQAHRELVRAMEKSDTAALARLFADDFFGIGLNAMPITKAEMAAGNNTPSATLITYQETDVVARILGSVAVTTSRASLVTRLGSGALIHRRNALTWIWERREGSWRVVGGQMQPMVLTPDSLEVPSSSKPGAAVEHLGDTEREALTAHLAQLTESRAEGKPRFAPGFLSVAPTGLVSGPPAVSSSAPPQLFEESGRAVIRTASGAAVVLDQFRAEAHGDTVAFTCRASYFDRTGTPTSQKRVGGTYVKRDDLWQQIFAQTTDIIAESTQ